MRASLNTLVVFHSFKHNIHFSLQRKNLRMAMQKCACKKLTRQVLLVGLNPENHVLDPLALQHLDNQLFMNANTHAHMD